MSVYKSPKSPFYGYDFQLDGRRFFGSTKARNKKEAEAIERQIRAKAKEDIEREKKTGNGPMTFDVAAGRYWSEVGQHHRGSSHKNTWHYLELLTQFFGNHVRLEDITDADVSALIAWRRTHTLRGKTEDKDGNPVPTVSNSTVNRTTVVVLKAIFTRAKRTWKYPLPVEPDWRSHWLEMPDERVRELDDKEAEALDGSVRNDYALWFEFARLTGLRRNETLIRWKNVTLKQIVTTGKRGRKVTAQITPSVRAILDRCMGHHTEWVFTYVCQRPVGGKVKGKRYPITPEGAKSQWRRLKQRSGVADFRFHDIRHDVATKLLRKTGNMRLVQKALNHSNIATTARYAHVLDDEVADAMENLARSRKNSRKKNADAA
ncbi:tyrosine-type recombinase/integrase [Mesorhizobium erdmanii]|uniref:Site-specific integrase n=1 Tax=Mesorhizobium erdmanii TaxID=1777866 RepID=A0A6M7U952_9HYPH|nr:MULTISPECIES: site-specific integrase [Mesorhizobium]OBQ67790.1 integrase [Mesorhizobium loti]QKC74189.1 site-specific integrase [Mesorhizobium erdmanii]